MATSGANQCLYCVVAHGAILRIRAKNPLIADQVATNYRKADITPRQMAMLDFALKVSQRSNEIVPPPPWYAGPANRVGDDLSAFANSSLPSTLTTSLENVHSPADLVPTA